MLCEDVYSTKERAAAEVLKKLEARSRAPRKGAKFVPELMDEVHVSFADQTLVNASGRGGCLLSVSHLVISRRN